MNPKDFLKNIMQDIKVELTEEFDRNFERKAFFDRSWKQPSLQNHRGSVMMRSGALRRSIRSTVQNGQIRWNSSLPYATIHNNGGEIVVTEKMKKVFWAMFFKADGAITMKRDKDKNVVTRNTERNRKLSAEAAQWKALALQKTGSKMKIEQRQFIGDHPRVRTLIEGVVDRNFDELKKAMINQMKK